MTAGELRKLVAEMPPEWDDLEVVRDHATYGYDGTLTRTTLRDGRTVVELQ